MSIAWVAFEVRDIFVFASYIRSVDNTVADAESRRIHPDIEWELAPNAFKKIIDKFGHPQIDLFATRINKKCEVYISWHRDPEAYAINAFTVQCNNFFMCSPSFLLY